MFPDVLENLSEGAVVFGLCAHDEPATPEER